MSIYRYTTHQRSGNYSHTIPIVIVGPNHYIPCVGGWEVCCENRSIDSTHSVCLYTSRSLFYLSYIDLGRPYGSLSN